MKVYYAYGSDVESHDTFGIFSSLEKAQADLMERATKDVKDIWGKPYWTYIIEEWTVDGSIGAWWRIEYNSDAKELTWFKGIS